MRELEAAHLLPGQEVLVGKSQDGELSVLVDGVSVTLEQLVAAKVYVTV
jgi:hypothetical protein